MGPTGQAAAKEGVGHLPDIRRPLRQLEEATPKATGTNHLTTSGDAANLKDREDSYSVSPNLICCHTGVASRVINSRCHCQVTLHTGEHA